MANKPRRVRSELETYATNQDMDELCAAFAEVTEELNDQTIADPPSPCWVKIPFLGGGLAELHRARLL